VGTPDGVFNVGRADAIIDFQRSLVGEANPEVGGAWLPSWMKPVPSDGRANPMLAFTVAYRGGLGISGSGENVEALARQLNALHQPTVVLNEWESDIGSRLSTAASSTSFIRSVNTMGHSFGAGAAVTTPWETPGVQFTSVYTVDSVCFYPCNTISGNVNTNYNAYHSSVLWGGDNTGRSNIQNTYIPDVNHFSIMDRDQSPVPGMIVTRIIGGP
jgi:hypothetical protein